MLPFHVFKNCHINDCFFSLNVCLFLPNVYPSEIFCFQPFNENNLHCHNVFVKVLSCKTCLDFNRTSWRQFPHYILSLSCVCLFSSVCHVSSLPTLQDEEKEAAPASKKPGKGRPSLGREKSADSSSTSSSASAEKQRHEARKRLLAAKKAASFRQNSATESADSIEIYVPEAQTRLWERQRK